MKKFLFPAMLLMACFHAHAQNAKMNAFISKLMAKMTLDEKIGQLNLVTPGGAVTGSVVSQDVDGKIRKGEVGGLFGITGPDKVRQAQQIAVNNSRLHIPLIFGLLPTDSTGLSAPWWILPATRAGAGFPKATGKTLFLVRRLQKPWCMATRAAITAAPIH